MAQAHGGLTYMDFGRAREAGAAANYAGSGGAIAAVCTHAHHRARVASALARIGCATLAG